MEHPFRDTMGAIIIISYLILCLVAGALFTTVVAMFRSVSGHDNFMSWRWILGFSVVAAVAPYVYMDINTRRYGSALDKVVDQTLSAIRINGNLAYYRVTNGDENAVRILAVGNETTSIRMNEKIIVEINAVKDQRNRWVVKEYEVLNSFERQKDAVVLPPMF
jgi:hypothetical protein